jgi:hypothetical protein
MHSMLADFAYLRLRWPFQDCLVLAAPSNPICRTMGALA